MKTNTLNAAVLGALITKGSDAYKARTLPGQQNLTKSGMQKDCARALESINALTAPQWDQLNALGLGDEAIKGIDTLARATNTKVVLRGAQVLASLAGGKVPGGSGRTLFLAVGAVAVAGCKTRDGLQFAVTGKGNANSSDGVMIDVARKLQRMGVTSPASFATQYSVCFAQGALGDVFGIGHKGKKGEMPTIDQQAPFARAILTKIANLTDIEIEQMTPAPDAPADAPKPAPKRTRKGK